MKSGPPQSLYWTVSLTWKHLKRKGEQKYILNLDSYDQMIEWKWEPILILTD